MACWKMPAHVHVGIPAWGAPGDFAITLGKCSRKPAGRQFPCVQEPDAALVSSPGSRYSFCCRHWLPVPDSGFLAAAHSTILPWKVSMFFSPGAMPPFTAAVCSDDLFYHQLFAAAQSRFCLNGHACAPLPITRTRVECKNRERAFSRIVSDEKAAKQSAAALVRQKGRKVRGLGQ